ncbi:hypothetical protein LP420_15425 [Massilia sp. B-10]|nr:hypothetical protein LP420_15425 [Massilia sp. B-10]
MATPYWLNEKRLVFGVVNITPGDTDSSAGLYAIDADGGKLTGIEKSGAVKRRFDQMPCFACGERSMDSLVHHSPERSDNFFIHVRFGGENGIGKVNARTKIIDEVDVPNWSYAWAVDEEERVRVTLSMGDGQTVLNYRGRTGDWRKVARFDPNAGDAFYPVLFANDALYVASRKGGNESGIYRYDLEQGRIADEPLVSAPGFDVVIDWLSDGKKIIACVRHHRRPAHHLVRRADEAAAGRNRRAAAQYGEPRAAPAPAARPRTCWWTPTHRPSRTPGSPSTATRKS